MGLGLDQHTHLHLLGIHLPVVHARVRGLLALGLRFRHARVPRAPLLGKARDGVRVRVRVSGQWEGLGLG